MEENKNIKIFVITHKKYEFPKDDMYIPLHVGREGKQSLGYVEDNTGDNISAKNSSFCELTGLYWMWKNVNDCEYIGLNHYRRYFTTKKDSPFVKNKFDLILKKNEIEELLKENDIIVSNNQKLIIKDVYGKYNQQHYIKDLDECRKIIEQKYPEYIESFDKVMKSKQLCICNMFITNKKLMDEYCTWLFDILFEAEKRTDTTGYSTLQKRVYGFLSERLFNVWLEHKKLKIYHLPILRLEHDSIKTIAKKSYKRIMKIKS